MGGGKGDCIIEGEGISHITYMYNSDTDNSEVMARGKGGVGRGLVEAGKGWG